MSIIQLMLGGISHNLSGDGTADGSDPDSPYSSTAGFVIWNDGTFDKYEDGGYFQLQALTDWRIPNGVNIGADYECRCTVTSGSSPNGSNVADTWYSLDGVGRSFLITRTSAGVSTGTWTFEIRYASTSEIVATGTGYVATCTNGVPP